MVHTVVNKDGSVTTSSDDEHELVAGPQLGQAKVASGAEAKVVESDDKPAAKTRSRASTK